MAIQKIPSGTRGGRPMPKLVGKVLMPLMIRIHRRGHDRTRGMDLLYLTTTGAKSGQRRTVPVARFSNEGLGWIVVASAAGAVTHPGWYHNIVAHPDEVEVEVSGTKHQVTVRQLDGVERDAAWATVVAAAPGFERGADVCMLFADQANPTSNGVYARLGYERVCPWVMLSFGAGQPVSPGG